MIKNYTEDAKQRCLELIDSDIENIWNSIEQMPTDTDAQKWKKKLKSIAKEYTFSSRFALMRIFLDRAAADQLIDMNNPSCGFVAVLSDGTECALRDITIEHAENSTEEEIFQFEELLLDQASRQSDFDAMKDALIIKKALFPVQRKTTLLTRGEAFQLGHILQFTLQEMERFLLRVFDADDGFRYNTANGLIEAYGFLTDCSWQKVYSLKGQYAELCGKDDDGNYRVPKANYETRENDWTKDAGGSLQGKVRYWSVYDGENQDDWFLKWLIERAPFLDVPSKTAVRVYRNLAIFAHNLAIQAEAAPDVDTKKTRISQEDKETDFVRCIREIVQEKDYADQTLEALFDNDTISSVKCKLVADTLLLENLNFSFSDQTDKTKAWHVIQVMTDGQMTVSGGVNESRTRVRDILSGKVESIEKSDMLYLLWFTSNLCWFDGKSRLSPEDIKNRLNDFIDASELCLDAAGLPKFYPPHLVEQSMMLSVVYAFGGADKCDPAETYEQICSAVIKHKAKKKAGDKSEFPNRIASLRRQLKLNQTQLAEQLGITQTTISAWERGTSEPPETYKSRLAYLFGTSIEFMMDPDE